jgi:DNA recombination protein RmuC
MAYNGNQMSLNLFLLLLAGLVLVAFAFLIYSLIGSIRRQGGQIEEVRRAQSENKAMDLMQQQIGLLSKNLNQQLDLMSGQFRQTTGHIGTTLGNVKQDLGRMEQVTREVLDKAKNISNLENLLRAPKFRGGLGELFLGDLLSQILPPKHFELQHRFKSGEMVDAVVRLGDNMVPIDAKFPLENFRKSLAAEDDRERDALRKLFAADVRKHITDIAKKYILPDEGTYDFALMYIPAENVYYETILREENLGEERSLFGYATAKRVIPVSPNSFFAYLQVIVLGLKGLQIEKSARDIFQTVSRLQGDINRFRTDFSKIGTHLGNARSKYEEAEKRLDRFTDKLDKLGGHEVEQLEPAENPDGGD